MDLPAARPTVLQCILVLKVILPALVLVAIGSTLAATPAKPHKRKHASTASATVAHKRSAKSTATKATSAKATKTAARRKGKISRSPARSYQQAPTADRYREIQQALVSKGYLHGEPNGAWDADSADALKRFQSDQSLMPDGKINSLSLIALGLGPKRLTAKSDAAPPAASTAPTTPISPPQ
jgi:Putative peptidoglycan binding domain